MEKHCKLSFLYRNETAGTAKIYGSFTNLCVFVTARDMTIFNLAVQINPPSISAYVVSVGFYQIIIRRDKTS